MPADFEKAFALIDEAHSEDPTKVTVASKTIAYELHYSQQSTAYLLKHTPDASETLSLAVRAQHFRRWEIARSSYPMTKAGYFAWRTFLKKRQGEMASQICRDCGYGDKDVEHVAALIRKEGLTSGDPEAQALEDVACLVFLDDQFEEFEKNHDEDKIINILRKTWKKMGEKGRAMALEMAMEGRPAELIKRALEG